MTQDECTQYGWHGDGHISIDNLPDYLNDLNAMHEAEKMLDITKVEEYCSTLVRIVRHSLGIDDYESIYPTRFAVYATAAQRAEAFLRTIGKWTTNQNEL
jgi:hypothetical protein